MIKTFLLRVCVVTVDCEKIIFRDILISSSDDLDQKDPPSSCSSICEHTHFPRVGAALTSYNSCLSRGVRAEHLLH